MRSEQDVFQDLEALCRSPGYAHAIGYFCLRDNVIGYTGTLTAEDMEHQFSLSRLIRTEISTLLGLLVKGPIDFAPPGAEAIESYIKQTEALLEELHQLMSAVWMTSLSSRKPETDEHKVFTTGDALREPIFYGGESAYNFQYRDLAPRKYAEDDEWLKDKCGFSISQANLIVRAIGEIQNEKLTISTMSFSASSPTGDMLCGFVLTATEITNRSKLHPSLIRRYLESFGLSFADRNATFTSLHEFNATNAKPILPFTDDAYLLFQCYSLEESLYESPFYWMALDKGYFPKAAAHRGRFTEQFTYERLLRSFGSKNVYRNVTLQKKKGEEVSEIDVFVQFGDRAFVVQTKSKRLTVGSKKGNDLQIQSDFKAAVQDAYDQAYLCAASLVQNDCVLLDAEDKRIDLQHQLRSIYPICVVADHYPALAFQARQFLKSHTTDVIRSPLVMDVFAIDAITEFLDTPLYFLSYIDRRSTFLDRFLMTHEMTILSFHLKRNLWVNDDLDMIYLSDDISVGLDAAMMVRREGIPGADTPEGILTRYFGTPIDRIIRQIDGQANLATISLGLFLLQLGENAISDINTVLERIVGMARADHGNHDLSLAFGKSSVGITFHCNGLPTVEAEQRLHTHSEIRKYSSQVKQWFGVLLRPRDGLIRFCMELNYQWKFDAGKEEAVKIWERNSKPMQTRLRGMNEKRPGRNDPCQCGSGKKFKKCCL